MDPYNTLDTVTPGGPTVSPSDLKSEHDANLALAMTCLKHGRLPSEYVIMIIDHLEDSK